MVGSDFTWEVLRVVALPLWQVESKSCWGSVWPELWRNFLYLLTGRAALKLLTESFPWQVPEGNSRDGVCKWEIPERKVLI